jgi:hypothetical protein
VASVLTHTLDTVHECSTSAAVIVIRINEFIGSMVWLSVSRKRNMLLSSLSWGVMYASNSALMNLIIHIFNIIGARLHLMLGLVCGFRP